MQKAKTVAQKSSPATVAHHTKVLQAMRDIIDAETFDCVLSDPDMADAIRERGVYASHGIVRDCRMANGIPSAYARKMALFAVESGDAKGRAKARKRRSR